MPRLDAPLLRVIVAGLLALAAPVARATTAPPAARALRAPLAFEQNRGQADPAVRFLARGDGYAMLLSPDEIVLGLRAGTASADAGARVHMRFVGATPEPALAGLNALASRSHYFIGKDPTRWHAGIPQFGRVRYAGVYPGVDAVFYGNQRRLEFDLLVAPGTDPAGIVLGFRGAERVTIDDHGALVLHTAGGDVVQQRPLIYQDVAGTRRPVDGGLVRLGRRGNEERIGFRIGDYDRARPLVIDPILSYATYLGGSPDNDGLGIAVDSNKNVYVTGYTTSATFPTVGGLPDPNDDLSGTKDIFVAKYDSTGALVYATYLGGTGSFGDDDEQGNAIAVDDLGSVYVTGTTRSADFPTVNPLPSPNDALQGSFDAFVTKLGPSGDTIVYSTYLGGSASFDTGRAIAVDASHNAYVAGTTSSDDFPTMGGLTGAALDGATEAFVTKLSDDGDTLVYSTYLGGNGVDDARAIAVRMGEAYLTGETRSTDFPKVNGLPAPNDALRGFNDAFVTKLNSSGDTVLLSTYLGGTALDQGNAVAVDGDGNVYVGGETTSSTFPTAGGLPSPNNVFRGGADGFVAKLAAAGSALTFVDFLGGSFAGDDEEVNGIAIDGSRNVYVTGQTDANNFPVVNGLPLQNRRGSNNNAAIVAKIAAAGDALLYSTYLGGTAVDVGRGIAVDSAGAAYVVGQTRSDDFPVVNAEQPTRASAQAGGDAFVAKIDGGTAPAFAYTAGNVFVSATGFGEVREFTPMGTLVRALPLPSGAFANGSSPAGIAFDAAGHLYVADLIQNRIFEFDTDGTLIGPFATGINAGPESLVFDQAGHLYVSTTLGDSNVLKYDSDGMLLTQYDVEIHHAGNQWIDLAADQHTLFFTSTGDDVSQFDLATSTQLDDFFLGGDTTFGVRLLPSGMLVANSTDVLQLNASGDVADTYLANNDATLFVVSRDPDGVTFWTAQKGGGSLADGIVFRVNISSGTVPKQFTAAVPVDGAALGGLAVLGELTEARAGGAATPTPAPTPTITPTRTPAPEICDDCFDNDFDGDVDRDDAECPLRADGMGGGLGDPKVGGKAIAKCAKTLGKAGGKFEAAKLKGMQKCLLAAFACVQQKPGDATCLTKAGGTCAKALGKLPKDRTKLQGAVQKACATPSVALASLLDAIGLGYASETTGCAAEGVASLTSASDVAGCVAAEHACRAEDLAGSELPRAAELLQLAGVDPGDFPCLGAGADGGGGDLGASKGKLAVKCAKALTKAGAKFVSAKLKLVQKCAGAVYDCLQKKPTDAKCPPKASATCGKQLAKLTAPGKGAAAKLGATIAKSCSKAPLGLTDLLLENGLGFSALGGECAALDVPSVTSVADVSTCLEKHHECRVEQMLETEMPRLEELLGLGGIALP